MICFWASCRMRLTLFGKSIATKRRLPLSPTGRLANIQHESAIGALTLFQLSNMPACWATNIRAVEMHIFELPFLVVFAFDHTRELSLHDRRVFVRIVCID